MDKKMKKIFGMLMFCFLTLVLAPQSSVRAAYLGILGFEEDLEDGFEETAVYSPVDVRGYYEMNVKGMYRRTRRSPRSDTARMRNVFYLRRKSLERWT